MAVIKDEILMSYADGLLDPQTRAEIEAVLHSNPDCRQRLEVFQTIGASLAPLYEEPVHLPAPDYLVNLILNDRAEKLSSSGSAVKKTILSRLASKLSLNAPCMQGAFASAAILIAGVGAGWLLRSAGGAPASHEAGLVEFEHGNILAGGALQRVLETLPSGQEAAFGAAGNAITMRATLTFKRKDQTYCREYEISAPRDGEFAGLGCRDRSGKWALRVHMPTKDPLAPGDYTAPAGGGQESALEKIVDRMIDGDALGRKAEAAVIGNDWR